MQNENSKTPVCVVLSAPQGVTNLLVGLHDCLDSDSEAGKIVENLKAKTQQIIVDLANSLRATQSDNFDPSLVEKATGKEFERLARLMEGAKLLGHCPEQTGAQILTLGERISIILISWVFNCLNIEVSLIEPENFLVAESQSGDPLADIPLSKQKFSQYYNKLNSIALMPGFVGVSPSGNTMTLGRNGSDYSAAILAVCSQADVCEIWTDVDGVYNADPRLVKQAELI